MCGNGILRVEKYPEVRDVDVSICLELLSTTELTEI